MNNLCTESTRNVIELVTICISLSMLHISYNILYYKSIRVDTICNIITIVIIFHILHISNGNIYRVIVYENQTNFNF